MPAYVVAYVMVTDPPSMGAYASQVEAVTESFGGRYLFAGTGAEVLEGDWAQDGMAIIEFPSREAAWRSAFSGAYSGESYQRFAASCEGNSMIAMPSSDRSPSSTSAPGPTNR